MKDSGLTQHHRDEKLGGREGHGCDISYVCFDQKPRGWTGTSVRWWAGQTASSPIPLPTAKRPWLSAGDGSASLFWPCGRAPWTRLVDGYSFGHNSTRRNSPSNAVARTCKFLTTQH